MTMPDNPTKEWQSDQLEGLLRLRESLSRWEVNFTIVPPGTDMGYIEMLDVPHGPHAIYDPHSKTYDIWKWGRKRPDMNRTGLSVDDAADIMSTEYFLSKAKRVRKLHPNMTMKEIVRTLRNGYQRPSQRPVD